VRGGYDRFFGTRDDLPLFAVVSLTVTPERCSTPRYEDRARDARVAWHRAEEEGIAQRVERLTRRLQAVKVSETRRLQEVSEQLTAVQSRLHARRIRERARAPLPRAPLVRSDPPTADKEYLRVHLDESARRRSRGDVKRRVATAISALALTSNRGLPGAAARHCSAGALLRHPREVVPASSGAVRIEGPKVRAVTAGDASARSCASYHGPTPRRRRSPQATCVARTSA